MKQHSYQAGITQFRIGTINSGQFGFLQLIENPPPKFFCDTLKSARSARHYVGIISWADGKLPVEAFGAGLQASSALWYTAGSWNLVPTSSLHQEGKRGSEKACFWSLSGCSNLMGEFPWQETLRGASSKRSTSFFKVSRTPQGSVCPFLDGGCLASLCFMVSDLFPSLTLFYGCGW